MIQAYSQDITVTAMQLIPFNIVSIRKGCTATQASPTNFELNKSGVYEVSCGVSASVAETIQLYKDGAPVPDARRTGTSPGFVALVPVELSSSCGCCAVPAVLQVMAEDAATLADASIVITKLC